MTRLAAGTLTGMRTPLVPVSRDGSDSIDTHLGRPGNGWRPLVAPETRPRVEDALLLIGVGRAPEHVRTHLVRTLATEGVDAVLETRGEDLHVALVGPDESVRGAMDALPRMVAALRRR